jgi:hypothetical protein
MNADRRRCLIGSRPASAHRIDNRYR